MLWCQRLANDADILSLWTLLPLGDLKLDDLTFLEVAKTLPRNPGVVHEDVLPFLRSYEPVPFLPVEPLHGTLWHTLFLPPPGAGCPDSVPIYTTGSPRILPPSPPPMRSRSAIERRRRRLRAGNGGERHRPHGGADTRQRQPAHGDIQRPAQPLHDRGPAPAPLAGAHPASRPALQLVGGSRAVIDGGDRKSTRLNSSHANISYAVF